MTYFIAHEDGIIYGIGKTAQAALADALDFSDDLSKMEADECTERLYDEVQYSGGDIGFQYNTDAHMMDLYMPSHPNWKPE